MITVISEQEKERLKRELGYIYVENFFDGLAVAQKDGKWFHILESGQPAYEARFDFAEYFQHGRAWVRIGAAWYRIDTSGKTLMDRKNTSAD